MCQVTGERVRGMQSRKRGSVAQTIGIVVVGSVLVFVFIVVGLFGVAWYVNFGPGKEAHQRRRQIEHERFEAEERQRNRAWRSESSWRLPSFRIDRIVPADKLKPETQNGSGSDVAAS